MDIVTYLHSKLVVEHRFKIGGKYGKDPRPYMKKAITNWESDEERKREREVLLDYDTTLTIPDPAPSIEDSVIEKISLDDPEKEFLALRSIRGEKERALIRTVLLVESPLDSVREHLGIASKDDDVRQQFSRARKQIAADRDALFTYLLIIPTVSLGVTSAVVGTYGYDDGRISPPHCAVGSIR